jgi:hypothetical protein
MKNMPLLPVSHSIKIALGFALAGAVAFPAGTQAATNAQKQAAIQFWLSVVGNPTAS